MLVVIEIQINKYRNIRILTALNNYYQVFLDTHTKITIYLVIHKQITLKNNKKQNKTAHQRAKTLADSSQSNPLQPM